MSPISDRRRSSSVTTATQACKRCYARKRKCDRLLPRCTACLEADVPCELESKSSDKSLVMQMNDLRGQAVDLQKRVLWLEKLLQRADPTTYRRIHELPTDYQFESTTSRSLARQDPIIPITMFDLLSNEQAPRHVTLDEPSSASGHSALPTVVEALNYARAYLSSHVQTHHIVDQEEIEDDVRKVYGENGLIAPELAASRFRCFSIMYIEMISHRTHEEEWDNTVAMTCRSLAIKEVRNVVHGQDLLAVQSLLFLCRFAILEPGGPGLWQLVGMAARTAMAIRLHRRDDVYNALQLGTPEMDAVRHNEKRKNIFWAVYNLDRLATFTLSQPPSIRDSDIDVDLPSDPNPNANGSSVAIRVHSLHLRVLYGKIQESLYGVSVKSDRPIAEREAVVAEYVRQVQQWYRASPLKGAFVPISDAIINRQFLDDVSYHQMILSLHRPSPLIPDIPSSFLPILRDAASRSIDLYRHYFSRKEIPITWIHLFQIYTSCITLINCFSEYRKRPDMLEVPANEVDEKVTECRDLLAHFGPKWPESQLYQLTFDTVVNSYRTEAAPPQQMTIPACSTSNDFDFLAVDPSMLDLLGTLQDENDPGIYTTLAPGTNTMLSPNSLLRSFGLDSSDFAP